MPKPFPVRTTMYPQKRLPLVSKASDGSEPKAPSFVPCRGGGSGRSTAPQLAPSLLEKYPRIGSRKISFEPAASMLGRDGFTVMNVSLCGPHSLDTSTFVPRIWELV